MGVDRIYDKCRKLQESAKPKVAKVLTHASPKVTS
jgi:hypothetical protein